MRNLKPVASSGRRDVFAHLYLARVLLNKETFRQRLWESSPGFSGGSSPDDER